MHAPLPPSSAARLVVCPGSRRMMGLYPQEPTIESQAGDAAHYAGAQILRGQLTCAGEVAPNHVTLTDEMIEAAAAYSGHIIERDGFGSGSVEGLMNSGALHLDNWGTPDYWCYKPEELHLFVDDFKFGHRYVDERYNWQLINYAALILRHLGLYGDNRVRITMTIHQPRCYHRRGAHRSFTCTLGDLTAHLKQLSAAFRAAMAPDASVCAADPEQCFDCPGRHSCEAAIAAGYAAVDLAYDGTPLEMSPAALSKEFRVLKRAQKMITARVEGIEQNIMSSIKRGKPVPFFAIAHGAGRTVWRSDAADLGLADVASGYKVAINKPAFITPLQAIKAGVPESVVKMFSHSPGGAAELIEVDEDEAARIFNT